ncbi:hypothetical protein O5626_28575, partial [Escherichia coli]|nr:hypothetical protein [Escherichia coli]
APAQILRERLISRKIAGGLTRQVAEPDYWGLAGISSSKVPGVAGIGPKSATQLLFPIL